MFQNSWKPLGGLFFSSSCRTKYSCIHTVLVHYTKEPSSSSFLTTEGKRKIRQSVLAHIVAAFSTVAVRSPPPPPHPPGVCVCVCGGGAGAMLSFSGVRASSSSFFFFFFFWGGGGETYAVFHWDEGLDIFYWSKELVEVFCSHRWSKESVEGYAIFQWSKESVDVLCYLSLE